MAKEHEASLKAHAAPGPTASHGAGPPSSPQPAATDQAAAGGGAAAPSSPSAWVPDGADALLSIYQNAEAAFKLHLHFRPRDRGATRKLNRCAQKIRVRTKQLARLAKARQQQEARAAARQAKAEAAAAKKK
jgi:hypothetical protein